MDKPSKEALQAAAEWWAARLVSPTFDNLGPTRGQNRQETLTNDFASVLAGMAADQSGSPTLEQLDTFKESLVSRVEAAEYFPRSLYCDYNPDSLLAGAAQDAGIDLSRFPWKSGTWFYDGKVEAANGYRAPRTVIYEDRG